MSDAEIFAKRINDYVAQFGTESIKDVDGVLAVASFADKKGSILPTDYCYNRYNNGLGDFTGPHLFEYTEDKQFRILGENYPYSGKVIHKPKNGPERVWGYWTEGTLHRGEIEDLPENILLKRDDLAEGLTQMLTGIPVSVNVSKNEVHIRFDELLICGVCIEDETYKIFNATSDWAEKTTYHCVENVDGTWFYYLDTSEECIGECRRLVMFEAQKGKQQVVHKVSSELRRCFSEDVFKDAYRRMMDQADKNASAKDPMGEGERMPYGISKEMDNNIKKIDGGGKYGVGQHFGNGRASKSPYINWFVVSIYYFTDSKTIVLGIEKDRYPKLNQMNPIRYRSRDRKSDIAVFYESQKDKLDYKKLYDTFIDVSEQVMVLQGWH